MTHQSLNYVRDLKRMWEKQRTFTLAFPFISRATGVVWRIFEAFVLGIIGLRRVKKKKKKKNHNSLAEKHTGPFSNKDNLG